MDKAKVIAFAGAKNLRDGQRSRLPGKDGWCIVVRGMCGGKHFPQRRGLGDDDSTSPFLQCRARGNSNLNLHYPESPAETANGRVSRRYRSFFCITNHLATFRHSGLLQLIGFPAETPIARSEISEKPKFLWSPFRTVSSSSLPGASRLRLRSLPWGISERDIRALFKDFALHPDVESNVQFLRGKGNRPTGQAIVLLESDTEARRAVEKLNGVYIGKGFIEVLLDYSGATGSGSWMHVPRLGEKMDRNRFVGDNR